MTALGAADPVGEDEAAGLLAPLRAFPSVLLAVSGGPDSLALMHLAARWARKTPDAPALAVATVDHGLRAESEAEAAAVRSLATSLGLPHTVLVWTGPKPSTGVQSAARDARYALLAAHARAIGAGAVVTGHQSDDQAETVLMRLLVGSGPAGLAGMRPARPLDELMLLRPLLDIPKVRLVATVEAAGLTSVDDTGNASPHFARGRLRRLMPLLATEGLDRNRLLRLSQRAARAEKALADTADAAFARLVRRQGGVVVVYPGFAALPGEIAVRLLLRACAVAKACTATERAGPARLERAERLAAVLQEVGSTGRGLVRTLAGCRVAADGHGFVTITPESERRRGRRQG
jgi:tRNA(Ile)-lysidine synthase